MSLFHLEAEHFEWIDGARDDPKDLCLHGRFSAVIGEEVFSDDCTLSAAALYLLKSLTEDHAFGQDNQIFPCCGHFVIADDALQNVTIIGCPNGIDLQITHDNGNVIITTEKRNKVTIPYRDYQAEVFRFADQVKAFYDACTPKQLPEDDFTRNGYIAFWNEWERRRNYIV